METVELENLVRDIYIGLTEARNLIYNGREIQCDRKLQGCLKKCENILLLIQEDQKEELPKEGQ